jgi:Fe-S cluster assembly protein SufD
MSQTLTRTEFTNEGFEAFLHSRSEPDWLLERRRAAWQCFQQGHWPTQREEEWMRTDIRLFHLEKYSLAAECSHALPSAVLSAGVDLAGSCVSMDGVPRHHGLDPAWAGRGVIFGSLGQLVQEHGELIEKHLLTRVVDPRVDRFSALHGAFWSSGVFLYVPRGVVIDKPLHSIAAMSDGGSDLAHTLVILEDGAEATLLSESASPDVQAGGLHCGAVELIVGDGAHLRYVNLQDWGHAAWHFAHQKAVVGRDASIQWTVAALGSRLSKVNQHVSLNGEGGRCQVNGVMFTEGRQHLSYHTLQQHKQPHCVSDFLYKAALQDTSRTVWRGMIKVDPGAQKTDGYQRNDNLLLSRKARADSIPGLEIEADDVRCTHGSTSGKVDEELIFYARSRGFSRKEAIRMIVTGFFQQVFDRITIDSVREALGQAIARRVREYE